MEGYLTLGLGRQTRQKNQTTGETGSPAILGPKQKRKKKDTNPEGTKGEKGTTTTYPATAFLHHNLRHLSHQLIHSSAQLISQTESVLKLQDLHAQPNPILAK